MVDHNTSLSEELAAEIQVGLDKDADEIEDDQSTISELVSQLHDTNLKQAIPSFDDTTTIAAISSHSRSRPAFASILNGTAALSVRIELNNTTIHELSSDARTRIKLLDFIDARKQGRWLERELLFELVTEELQHGTDIILLDQPLTITRQEFLTRKDSPVWNDWLAMKQEQSEFWNNYHESLQPWAADGPCLLGWTRPRGSLLFTALKHGTTTDFVEAVNDDLTTLVQENADTIEQIGPHRILNELLDTNSRTLAYPYDLTELDTRWEPEALRTLGIQGLFCRFQTADSFAHLEMPGPADLWNQDIITDIIQQLNATTWLNKADIPLPLWYCRKECEFPDGVLDSYHAKLKQEINNDDT